jgi:hypothetical protein
VNPYLKYTQMGVLLVAYILAGYWLGKWLGPKAGIKESTGSVVGILFFLGLGLFKMVKEVLDEIK